ncbi:MAG TPA: GAF domain-containing protein [Pseudolysinimonas sp.]|nr:GAF domain-containing protein [Pseudolysinimonas sp.]
MPAAPVVFVLRAWYAFRLLRLRDTPQPADVPAVRSGNRAADRVLVIGNGPVHGWGVLTHQLAMTGQLAAALASRTDRDCDIDLVGAEAMNIRSVLAWIGDRELSAIDSIVIVVGANDALRLTPRTTWTHKLGELLDALASRLAPHAVVTVVGIPPHRSFGAYSGVVARLTERHRSALNSATRALAVERGVSYVELTPENAPRASPRADGQRGTDAQRMEMSYSDFAARIADDVAPRLMAARPKPIDRAAQPDKVWDWSGTPAIVELAREGGEAELRRLAEKAQKSFGVELAVVSLVDGDRLFHCTNTDLVPESVPLELSFCQYTVESGEPLVIPDTGRDPRFVDNPLVDVSFIRFYAGYPLRASDGRVIGSFCLQGSKRRKQSVIALDLLRQIAGEAQEILRGYENGDEPIPAARTHPAPVGQPVVFTE